MPLVSFTNPFFFFFDNENDYQCVLILVFIGDQAISFVVQILPFHASAYFRLCVVFRADCTQKQQLFVRNRVVSSHCESSDQPCYF